MHNASKVHTTQTHILCIRCRPYEGEELVFESQQNIIKRVQQLINLKISVLVRSLQSSNVGLS